MLENNTIGKSISELRKVKGITQDRLAEIVGVTAQAVSKWESGGNPDVELLPVIADYFGVSIDRLFNRSVNDYIDIEKALTEYIVGFPSYERMKKAFELCWTIEKGLFGSVDLDPRNDLNTILEKDRGPIYSQMLFNS